MIKVHGPIADTALPALRADARVDPGEAAALEVGADEYRFEGVDAVTFRAIVGRLDGSRTIARVADDTRLPWATVESVVEHLFDLRLATDLREAPKVVDATDLAAICRRLFPAWKERLFSRPFWVRLTNGTAARSLFTGWVLETFHFVHGANDRLPLAIACCSETPVRALLVRHYSEEYDHGRFFLDSLSALGVPPEVATKARPLPGTRAVLDFMRSCARRDVLQYALCSGFLESTGSDRLKAREFSEHLRRHYAEEFAGAVEPLVAHVDLDESYGHGALMEQVCQLLGPLDARRASAALEAARGLVETLELWSDDILRAYRMPSIRGDIASYRVSEATL